MNLFDKQQQAFRNRHIGPDALETALMLKSIGTDNLQKLVDDTVPSGI